MRVTRSQLRRIIKEEFRRVLREEPVRFEPMEIRAGDRSIPQWGEEVEVTGRVGVPQEELDFTDQLYDAANLMADEEHEQLFLGIAERLQSEQDDLAAAKQNTMDALDALARAGVEEAGAAAMVLDYD
jgi:hypothetical protein